MTSLSLITSRSTRISTPKQQHVQHLHNGLFGKHPTLTSHGTYSNRYLPNSYPHGDRNGNLTYHIWLHLNSNMLTNVGMIYDILFIMLLRMLLARKQYLLRINIGLLLTPLSQHYIGILLPGDENVPYAEEMMKKYLTLLKDNINIHDTYFALQCTRQNKHVGKNWWGR